MRPDSRSHPSRHRRQLRLLLGGSLVVVIASATALAFGSHRISTEQSAFSAAAAGRCTPRTLNRSAVLPGTNLAVTLSANAWIGIFLP